MDAHAGRCSMPRERWDCKSEGVGIFAPFFRESEGGRGMAFKNTEGIRPFEEKVWLARPSIYGESMKYVQEAYDTNWMTTAGENVTQVEAGISGKLGVKYAVALSAGTAALHMAMKLAGESVYGKPEIGKGALDNRRVFCSDLTFDATVNPVVYEGGIPVFIDTEYDTWNMDPVALEKAFEIYPDVKVVVVAHLYGTPGKVDEIREICKRHGAVIVEDAAESLGATYRGVQTGTFGTYNAISFNGNKIITGSSGGMFLTDDKEAMEKVKKWSTQSREAAPWYQHEELGYNYRMSNVIAGVVRGQIPYLENHIERKKAIYLKYKEGFKDLPVQMNPFDADRSEPNYWLSAMLIDEDAMCRQVRGEREALYVAEPGKSCPTEILETLANFNAEGRPVWKPMHMQPIYRMNAFITTAGNGRARTNAYMDGGVADVGMDIFERGLCLPSDITMDEGAQDTIIEIIKSCFA
jgi:dTDP-4-amino-4,6-dideoxygalactose transaminase